MKSVDDQPVAAAAAAAAAVVAAAAAAVVAAAAAAAVAVAAAAAAAVDDDDDDDYWTSADAANVAEEVVIELEPESEIDAGFPEHFVEKPVEIESAAPSGAASKQQTYFGDSVVAGIAEGM